MRSIEGYLCLIKLKFMQRRGVDIICTYPLYECINADGSTLLVRCVYHLYALLFLVSMALTTKCSYICVQYVSPIPVMVFPFFCWTNSLSKILSTFYFVFLFLLLIVQYLGILKMITSHAACK